MFNINLLFASYIDMHDATSVGPDANKYGVFYSVCQVSLFNLKFMLTYKLPM